MNRRSLIGKLIAGAGAIALSQQSASAKPKDLPRGVFIHHVLFWMKEPLNMGHRKVLEAGLRKLVTIDLIKQRHVGIPADTNRDVVENTYQYSLLLTFKNKADHDAYQIHPEHLEFIENCSHTWERVRVHDTVDISALEHSSFQTGDYPPTSRG